jgi:hypothetical protein
MESQLSDLKGNIKKYREIDNKLRSVNKQVQELRETRKLIELELSSILTLPDFKGFDKLKIEDDGTTIRIKRPESYSKPWSLSQKDLLDYLESYFQSTTSPDSQACFEYIVNQHKKKLVASDFTFERIVPDDK